MMTVKDKDTRFMQKALDLAASGLGGVAPNPSVGCVIVKDDKVIAQARTAVGGRPHAEQQALQIAGSAAKGATVYVSLEPCNNHGVTGPCIDALIKAEVARVVIACDDPYQQQNYPGGGEKLEAAGISVRRGILGREAWLLNEGFFMRVAEGRPLVSAKMATSLDAKIATKTGVSKWLTGNAARMRGHEFRMQNDAVLCGIRTVIADDPMLNVRLIDYDGHQPIRIVIDRDLKMPVKSKLVLTAKEQDCWVICRKDDDGQERSAKDIEAYQLKLRQLRDFGVRLMPIATSANGQFHPKDILKALGKKGITRLMIEGGGYTISSFIVADMVDRLLWFRSPQLIGADGVPAVHNLGVETLENRFKFKMESFERTGEDFLEIWRRKD